MTLEHGKVEGDITIRSDFQMHGMFLGKVTVTAGGYLRLHGMATQDLLIESGATVEIHGMAKNVINNGGHLTIKGMVTGCLTELGGETQVLPGAMVHSK